MKISLLFVVISLLAGCTNLAKSPQQWERQQNVTFNKKNFSYEEYGRDSSKCFSHAKDRDRLADVYQKDLYMSCMKQKNYNEVEINEASFKKREEAVAKYITARTPTKNNFFDHAHFKDAQFIEDVKECRGQANTIRVHGDRLITSLNPVEALTSAIITGASNSMRTAQKREKYRFDCMYKKEYFLSNLPPTEIQRRAGLIKE